MQSRSLMRGVEAEGHADADREQERQLRLFTRHGPSDQDLLSQARLTRV